MASTKQGRQLYVIECKKGTNLRQIGHAFGQLYVDELIIRRIKKKEWLKFIKEKINPDMIDCRPEIIFGVAFHEIVRKDKNAKKIINQFAKKFENYRVFFVKSKKDVKTKKNRI